MPDDFDERFDRLFGGSDASSSGAGVDAEPSFGDRADAPSSKDLPDAASPRGTDDDFEDRSSYGKKILAMALS